MSTGATSHNSMCIYFVCRIATSFTGVVNSLVSDILLPPISLLPFMSHKNLPEKFVVLRKGPHGDKGYNTINQAIEDGAVTMNYG